MRSNKEMKQFWGEVYDILKKKIGPDCACKVLLEYLKRNIPENSFSNKNSMDIMTVIRFGRDLTKNIISDDQLNLLKKGTISKIAPICVFETFLDENILELYKDNDYFGSRKMRNTMEIFKFINLKEWLMLRKKIKAKHEQRHRYNISNQTI